MLQIFDIKLLVEDREKMDLFYTAKESEELKAEFNKHFEGILSIIESLYKNYVNRSSDSSEVGIYLAE